LIAADTSSIVNFLTGANTPDRPLVRRALAALDLCLPPPVKTELLSGTTPLIGMDALFAAAPMMPLAEGFWDRAGESRRVLLARGLKAKLADALIAQCCIDADVTLIARDGDFRHFAQWCGLKLAGQP
jgi:predicted nucleic acid-binding protein